jgi:haloalkane dehalogenase
MQSWVNRTEYPFQTLTMPVDGGDMNYVDEGTGRPIVMVHGTPAWSFLYRHLIKGLSPEFRVVAPDHIGFGLSDKPEKWGYKPADHARNLTNLIETLDLRDITLVVHDFGGPIGLSYAIAHPENVSRLVIFNTFMWSLRGSSTFERPNRLMNNPLGRFLYRGLNFSPAVMVRAAWGDRTKLTPEIHRHYKDALPNPAARQGTWVFLQELIGSSDWFDSLWQRRDCIAGKPALLLWGMKDIAFREPELARFEGLFTIHRTIRYPEAGHFVQEEEGPALVAPIREFLA